MSSADSLNSPAETLQEESRRRYDEVEHHKMLQRDYVLRLIEQFARAVASVIRLRSAGDSKAAQVELAHLSQGFLGIDAKLLLSLSDGELLSLFVGSGELDSGRAVVAQQILSEEAAIQEALGDAALTQVYRLRGLSLLLEVLTTDLRFRTPEYLADLTRLLEMVGDVSTPSIRIRLFRYFDAIGKYAEAEDRLFELLDVGVNFGEVLPEGLAFYERLLTFSDAELARGDLPRAEVEEGMLQLKKWKQTRSSTLPLLEH